MRISFNIDKLITIYFPELLRKVKHLAWLQSCSRPLKTAYQSFLIWRNEKLYEASITGETNRLERALQDRYNDVGIYIIHQLDYLDTAWIWTKHEPVFHEWDYLKTESDPTPEADYLRDEYDPEFDFIVRVPTAQLQNVEEMKVWLRRYVMAGKKYKVELY